MNSALSKRLGKLESEQHPAKIELTLVLTTDNEKLLASSPEVHDTGLTIIYQRAQEVTHHEHQGQADKT